MTISVLQANGSTVDNVTSGTHAMVSNVAANSLLIVMVSKETLGASDPCVVGDLTKSAGTATIGTPVLDLAFNIAITDTGNPINLGIWSVLVTGAGSLTLAIAGSTYYGIIGVVEASGDWDAARLEDSNSAGSDTNNQTAESSGDATSAGAALFAGVLGLPSSSAQTITPDAAWTLVKEELNGSSHTVGSIIRRLVATGTTDAASWTSIADNWGSAAAVAVYKEAGGGPPPVTDGPPLVVVQSNLRF